MFCIGICNVAYGQHKLLKKAHRTSDLIIQGEFISETKKIIRYLEVGETRRDLFPLLITKILKNKAHNHLQLGNTIFVPIVMERGTSNPQKERLLQPRIDITAADCI